jgi:hypothetical protein
MTEKTVTFQLSKKDHEKLHKKAKEHGQFIPYFVKNIVLKELNNVTTASKEV